jgi:hypothetical protein
MAIPCGAATFEKVSVSYSVSRQGILQCPLANNPTDLSWTFSQTIDGFNITSTFWSDTPILRKDNDLLVRIDDVNNVGSDMYADQSGGEEGSMETGGKIYSRVNAYTFQRPIFEVWRTAYGSSYTLNMSVATNTEAYYRIRAVDGENEGDEVTLKIDGWTSTSHSSRGPDGTAIVQIISPAGVTGFNNIAYTPDYVNQSDGVWHNVPGIRYSTARIGDVIGLRTAVFSAMGPVMGASIKNWFNNYYSPCSFTASSNLNASIVPKPVPGDVDGNNVVNISDAIIALQALSGMEPFRLRYDYVAAGIDISGDNKVGLEEVIGIIQITAGLRQN